jgi:GNAT superfamily N-acetyltransferase
MNASARPASLEDIRPWRDLFRQEMNCQITKDSIHSRPGWTREYQLFVGDVAVGYGSLAVAGPWKEKPTAYEFFVMPPWRNRTFDLFEAFLAESGAVAIEHQSNGGLLSVMIHAYARGVETEAIVFHDRITTHHPAPDGAVFRPERPDERPEEADGVPGWEFVLDVGGAVAARGGVLWHYNRPYGDIFMEVAESHRRRGLGTYLVQEMKRVTYERGGVPAARCNPGNVASRRTLQKAGFVPCGHILTGTVALTSSR